MVMIMFMVKIKDRVKDNDSDSDRNRSINRNNDSDSDIISDGNRNRNRNRNGNGDGDGKKLSHPVEDPANIHALTYEAVDKSIWLWSRDTINQFRVHCLSLPPVYKKSSGSRILRKRRIPFVYCFSHELIQKPKDWGPWID
eukprot:Pgem_evm1s3891